MFTKIKQQIPDNSAIIAEYNRNGFVICKNFISQPGIEIVNRGIHRLISQHSPKNIIKTGNKINSIHDLHLYPNSVFMLLANCEAFLSLTSQLLGSAVTIQANQLFLKPANDGIEILPHQDDYFWCLKDSNGLTAWLCLGESNKQNGGIFYYKGSHKLGLLKHHPADVPGSSQTVIKSELKKIEKNKVCLNLRAGDVVFHHALTVHGSENNKSNIGRPGLAIQYIPISAEYDIERKKKYRAQLEKQIKKLQHIEITY